MPVTNMARLGSSGSPMLSGLSRGFARLSGQLAVFGHEGLRAGLFRQFAWLGRQGLGGLCGQVAVFGYEGLRPGLPGKSGGLRCQRLGELVAGLFGFTLGEAPVVVGHAVSLRLAECTDVPR